MCQSFRKRACIIFWTRTIAPTEPNGFAFSWRLGPTGRPLGIRWAPLGSLSKLTILGRQAAPAGLLCRTARRLCVALGVCSSHGARADGNGVQGGVSFDADPAALWVLPRVLPPACGLPRVLPPAVVLSRGPPASLCADRGSSGQPAVPGDTTPQTKTGGGKNVQKVPPSTRGRPVCRWQVSTFRATDALATQEGFYKQRGRPR